MECRFQYNDPVLLPNKTVGYVERTAEFDATDYDEANAKANNCLIVGGLVFGGKLHCRTYIRLTCGTISPEARPAMEKFFAWKSEHPEVTPYDQLTGLQKRMQDGIPYPHK